MYFSPSTRCFYDGALRSAYEASGTWPDDVREVSQEVFQACLAARAAGLVIEADANGNPVAVDPPPPSSDMLWSALRAERDTRLARALAVLDRHRNQVDFGLPATLSADQARAWAAYAQALRDLPEATTDPVLPEWPELPASTPTEGSSE